MKHIRPIPSAGLIPTWDWENDPFLTLPPRNAFAQASALFVMYLEHSVGWAGEHDHVMSDAFFQMAEESLAECMEIIAQVQSHQSTNWLPPTA